MPPAGCTRDTAASSTTSTASTRRSSASRRARRAAWTRSSACCSRWPGRRSSTPVRLRRAWPAPPPACSSGSARNDYAHLLGPGRCARRRRPLLRHRDGAQRRGRPPVLRPRPAGPERGRRHRVLLVARRGPPRLPEPARRGECRLALAGGVNLDPLARAHRQLLPGAHAVAGRPLPDVRRRRRRLRARRGRRRGRAQAAARRAGGRRPRSSP